MHFQTGGSVRKVSKTRYYWNYIRVNTFTKKEKGLASTIETLITIAPLQ